MSSAGCRTTALVAAILFLCGASAWTEDRPMFGRSQGRTHAPDESVPLPLTFLWSLSPAGGQFETSPVVLGDRLYLSGRSKLCEVDGQSASVANCLALEGLVQSEVTYSEGRLYLGTSTGQLLRVRCSDLAVDWMVNHGAGQHSSPLVTDEAVIVGLGYPLHEARAYERETGALLWACDVGQPCNSSAALLGGMAYIGAGNGKLFGVNVTDGTFPEWELATAGSVGVLTAAAIPGMVVFAPGEAVPSDSYHVYASDPGNGGFLAGARMATRDVNSSSPAVAGSKAYVTHVWSRYAGTRYWRAHVLHAVDLTTGTIAWSTLPMDFAMEETAAVANPIVSGGVVYAAFGNQLRAWDAALGTTLAIDGADWDGDADPNALTFSNATAIFATPALANGRVYVVANDGVLYAFQSANTAPSVPAGLTPDGGSATWDTTPLLSWVAASDPEEGSANLSYIVEAAFGQDPEFGADCSGIVVAGATSWEVTPAIAVDTHVFWRVRAQDGNKAQSAWSATADFWIRPPPPAPPASITVLPLDGAARVIWEASPSPRAIEYFVYYKLETESWSQATRVAPGLAYEQMVGSLANNVTYDFMVTAADEYGFESAGVVDSTQPRPGVTLNDDYAIGYGNIAAAAGVAGPGDVITLGIGTYVEAVTLPPGVSLRGYAPHLTVLDGGGAQEVVTVDTSGSDPGVPITISQLSITGGVDGIVFLEPSGWAADVAIQNVVLYELAGEGVQIEHQSAIVAVKNVTAANNGGDGVNLNVANAVLGSSVATGNGGTGFVYRMRGSGTGLVSRYNNAWGNAGGNYDGAQGQGCFSGWVAYQDEGNDDYRVTGDAVTVDRGDANEGVGAEPAPNGTRRNQGAFGGTQWAAATLAVTAEQEIALGLGADGEGWMELFGGASQGYGHEAWRQFPWSGYNGAVGETRVAAGDLNGNGRSELVVGTGPHASNGGWMAVMHEAASGGTVLLKWLRVPWGAYNGINGETWPACGDVDGDGRDEIVVGLGPGGNGWFCVFGDEEEWFALRGWHRLPWGAYNTANGEARPAVGDVDGDGRGEVVLGLGPGGAGWLAVMGDGATGHGFEEWKRVSWLAYAQRAAAECHVSLGDLDGDGLAETVVGLGAGGRGYVWIMEDAPAGYADGGWVQLNWSVYNAAQGEVRPACGDVDGDGLAELVMGPGPYATSGGWVQVREDAGGGYASDGWLRVRWNAYNGANGEVWPATGNWR